MKGAALHMEEETRTFFGIISIAVMGGFVDYIRHKRGGAFQPLELVLSLIVAAFAGMEAHFIASWLELGVQLQFAIAGIAGYGGGVILDIGLAVLKKVIKARTSTQKK